MFLAKIEARAMMFGNEDFANPGKLDNAIHGPCSQPGGRVRNRGRFFYFFTRNPLKRLDSKK
jgi:hypothetical protein